MFKVCSLFGATLLMVACSGPPEEEVAGSQVAAGVAQEAASLDTYIEDSLEIDQLNGGPDDANLWVGNDPADGTASRQFPTGGPGTFIDWHDLAFDIANHRLPDLDVGKTDPSSFPLSNECVGASNVLSKMDLTYVASANNNTYAYFAVQRSANNGDAGWYWLFTKVAPDQILGGGKCSASKGHKQLMYTISGPVGGVGGDILLAGHFKPSSDMPLLTVYRADHDAYVTAYDAIDFASGLWNEYPGGVAAAAVNTTKTDPGDFGSDGVKSMVGADLGPELFAEAAVPLSIFNEGQLCDVTFWGSVITRSSGAGGTTPDLKDLAGPAEFNFGSLEVVAEMDPSCGLTSAYRLVSATGPSGDEISSPTCHWVFSDASTSDTCDGTATFAAHDYYDATLTITDPISSCEKTVPVTGVELWPPIEAHADLGATCESKFSYGATASGGNPSAEDSFSWVFSGAGGNPDSTSSSQASGFMGVDTGGVTYTGTVTVSEERYPGFFCDDDDTDTAVPYDGLEVVIAPTADAGTCPSMTTDAALYLSTVSGGLGPYTYTWSSDVGSCSGASCLVDPANDDWCVPEKDIYVTVDDAAEICPPVTSNIEHYSKSTIVSWTGFTP